MVLSGCERQRGMCAGHWYSVEWVSIQRDGAPGRKALEVKEAFGSGRQCLPGRQENGESLLPGSIGQNKDQEDKQSYGGDTTSDAITQRSLFGITARAQRNSLYLKWRRFRWFLWGILFRHYRILRNIYDLDNIIIFKVIQVVVVAIAPHAGTPGINV